MDPADALDALLDKPKRFLERYPIITAGAAAGTIDVYVHPELGKAQRPGSVLGTHRMHDTEGFRINTFPSGSDPRVRAYSIPIQKSNAGAPNFHALGTAADLMITGELSGCSFIVRQPAVGAIECAHIKPEGVSGVNLHTQLEGGGYDKVYGHKRYNKTTSTGALARNVTIIGVRVNGQWEIYAQKRENPNKLKVLSLHRVWPA